VLLSPVIGSFFEHDKPSKVSGNTTASDFLIDVFIVINLNV
jgi:hypothetical protein